MFKGYNLDLSKKEHQAFFNVNEEDIISEIDDREMSDKLLEKLYDLADKLSIKIITIKEILEKESQILVKESKLWKIELYETIYRTNDKQFKDFIKLYFNDISKIPLLTWEQERDIARRIKKWDEEAKKTLIESNLRLVISIANIVFNNSQAYQFEDTIISFIESNTEAVKTNITTEIL